MTTRIDRAFIYKAIDDEREHQDNKWGKYKPQSLIGFIRVMAKELQEAEDGWMQGIEQGRDSPLAEIVQVAATAVACLERYGIEGITVPTNDEPNL